MTTIYTHAVMGLGIAAVLAPRRPAWPYWVLAGLLPVLPDLDTLSLSSYSSVWGHRGFTHSLAFALALGLLAATLTGWYIGASFWRLAVVFFAATISHALLDMVTRGGNGVALWWPVSDERVGSWGPIPVADLAFDWPDPRRSRALQAELLYVWLPLAILVGLMAGIRLCWPSYGTGVTGPRQVSAFERPPDR
jgi:inner membrane protein